MAGRPEVRHVLVPDGMAFLGELVEYLLVVDGVASSASRCTIASHLRVS